MRVTKDQKIDMFDKNNSPVLFCRDGDTVTFETEDAFDGTVHYDGSVHQEEPYMRNPATGPVYIEGAEPGDTLCVEILSIRPNGYGVVGSAIGWYAFSHYEKDYSVHVYDYRDGYVDFCGRKLRANPMMGVIGVAPEGEKVRSVGAGTHGGNMDCTQVKEGAKIYLPVFVPGALFATGDMHIAMGEGEVVGYGVESGGEVTVRFSLIKGSRPERPVLCVDGKVMVLASEDTLDKAATAATRYMHELLLKGGWSVSEAAMLMSLKCDLTVCQFVGSLNTVRAVIDADLMKK